MTLYKCEWCRRTRDIPPAELKEPQSRYAPCECGEIMHKVDPPKGAK